MQQDSAGLDGDMIQNLRRADQRNGGFSNFIISPLGTS
jgi:hypothetical protein